MVFVGETVTLAEVNVFSPKFAPVPIVASSAKSANPSAHVGPRRPVVVDHGQPLC
jgi:hypothetical protein